MAARPLLRSRRRSLVALAALVAVVVVPSPSPTAAAPDRPAAPGVAALPAALPAPFAGTVEEFYEVPDPLPPGARGEIIRIQPVTTGADRTGWRIMYHSVDEAGQDRAVTGTVTVPTAAAPDGGWPVIAWAHGTTGISEDCAPSRGPSLPGGYGIEGVVVQTDYIGLGPVGELHPYLQRAAESNAVLDSVRAAHEVGGDEVADEWFLVGGSQGGHAALAANEDAVTELPEYPLLGTVALVPGAEVGRTFDDEVQVRIIVAFALFGNQDEPGAPDPRDLFTPEAYAALEGPMTEQCAGQAIPAALPFALADTMYQVDIEQDPAVRAFRQRNEVGRVRGASPVFVAGGVQDITVVIARVRALRESLCSIGQPLTYVEAPEGDHNTTGAIVAPEAMAWLQARAAGEALASDCPDPSVPTTSTPTSTPGPSGVGAGQAPGARPVAGRPAYTG